MVQIVHLGLETEVYQWCLGWNPSGRQNLNLHDWLGSEAPHVARINRIWFCKMTKHLNLSSNWLSWCWLGLVLCCNRRGWSGVGIASVCSSLCASICSFKVTCVLAAAASVTNDYGLMRYSIQPKSPWAQLVGCDCLSEHVRVDCLIEYRIFSSVHHQSPTDEPVSWSNRNFSGRA